MIAQLTYPSFAHSSHSTANPVTFQTDIVYNRTGNFFSKKQRSVFGETLAIWFTFFSYQLVHLSYIYIYIYIRGSSLSAVAIVLGCDIAARMFAITFTLGQISKESPKSPYPPSQLRIWFWHWIIYEGWYAIKQRNQNKLIYIYIYIYI